MTEPSAAGEERPSPVSGAGMPIFGGEEAGLGSLEGARVAVIPIPLERTVSYGGGTAAGPAAILRASRELEFFDEERWAPRWPPGAVHTRPAVALPSDPAAVAGVIEGATAEVLAAATIPLLLGGEHSITAPAFRAVAAREQDLGLLVLDAHLDLRDRYDGTPHSHACVVRRIVDGHGIAPAWCGVRSVAEEEARFLDEREWRPVFAHELDPEGAWISRALAALPERVYLSIDVDALDPAVIPGTGTPEPGGLSYRQVGQLIARLTAERTVVAADLVELAPIPHQQVSEYTAAKIAARLIGALCRR